MPSAVAEARTPVYRHTVLAVAPKVAASPVPGPTMHAVAPIKVAATPLPAPHVLSAAPPAALIAYLNAIQ